MNVVKYNKGGKFKVSSATKSVPAPAGFHWMDRWVVDTISMKGDYKPHLALLRAKFKLAKPCLIIIHLGTGILINRASLILMAICLELSLVP